MLSLSPICIQDRLPDQTYLKPCTNNCFGRGKLVGLGMQLFWLWQIRRSWQAIILVVANKMVVATIANLLQLGLDLQFQISQNLQLRKDVSSMLPETCNS